MSRHGRETSCLLVKVGRSNFLLDCGSGLGRLLEASPLEMLGSEPLHILLSHYHLDHCIGLFMLPALMARFRGRIRLVGPSDALVEYGLRKACATLLSPPLSSLGDGFLRQLEMIECGPEGLALEGIAIGMTPQDHPGGSVSIRLGNDICYATDLSPATEWLEAASGVRCLIHEVWMLEQEGGRHSCLQDAIRRARKAGARYLVPVHFSPDMAEEHIRTLEGFSREDLCVLCPMEGRRIALP